MAFSLLFCQSSFKDSLAQRSAGSAKEILEFLFGDEITDAQKQKAMDAAVAEDLHLGENGFSFHGFLTENHTSDMDDLD